MKPKSDFENFLMEKWHWFAAGAGVSMLLAASVFAFLGFGVDRNRLFCLFVLPVLFFPVLSFFFQNGHCSDVVQIAYNTIAVVINTEHTHRSPHAPFSSVLRHRISKYRSISSFPAFASI